MANVKPNFDKNGKIISYRLYAYIGIDEITGKKKQMTKTVPPPAGLSPNKALKRLQTEADHWETEMKDGKAPDQKTTFKHFIECDFIPAHVCNGKHSPSTILFYKDICAQLVEEFGKKQLNGITSLEITKYISKLSNMTYKRGKNGEEKKYSQAYIKHFATVLTVAFDFAVRHRLVIGNPMTLVDPVTSGHKEVDALSEAEAERLFNCLDSDAPLFWQTAIRIMYRNGLRRGEVAGLKWENIDFENETLMVRNNVINNRETGFKNVLKAPKSKSSIRDIPITPDVLELLKRWKVEQATQYGVALLPSAFVFGSPVDPYNPIRPDSITQWFARFNERHNLRCVSPHDLRHTCATELIRYGASTKATQTIMGHSDSSITNKYYVKVNQSDLRSAMDRVSAGHDKQRKKEAQ